MAWVLAVLTLRAAAYAHYRWAEETSRAAARWLTRILLLVLGFGFGRTVSQRYYPPAAAWNQLGVCLSAFGVAHVPAACILLIKHLRGHSFGHTGQWVLRFFVS